MHPSLTDYMDAAWDRQRLSSDRALARKLDVQQTIVHRWRSGTGLPTDKQMLALARLAAADETQALVLLNIWRAKDEPARDTYRRLLRRLSGGTGTALAVALTIGLTAPAKAESPGVERTANKLTVNFPELYIMRYSVVTGLEDQQFRLPKNPAPPSIADEPWAHAFTT